MGPSTFERTCIVQVLQNYVKFKHCLVKYSKVEVQVPLNVLKVQLKYIMITDKSAYLVYIIIYIIISNEH